MITRSQIRRQLRKGGIASLPRQGYGFGDIVGGIGDVLGGVADKAKEIVKSDAGKAALIGAGIYGLGGGFGQGFKWGNLPGAGFFGKGSFNPLLRKVGGDFAQSKLGSLISGFPGGGLGLTAAGLGGAALMAPSIPSPEKKMLSAMQQRGEDIEPYLRDWYKKYYTANWQEGWTQEGEDEFVRVNTSEYNKGGRVGYARGPEEPILPEDISELGEDINLQQLIQEEGIPIGEQVKKEDKELEAGAADIKVTGDVTPDLEEFIIKKWVQLGGKRGDKIPAAFRDAIINNLQASAPHPDENWMGLWEKHNPSGINTLDEFKEWHRNQDLDEEMFYGSKGGRAGMQKGGRGLLSLSHLPWLKLLEEEEYKKGGRIGKFGGGLGVLPGIPRMAADGLEYDMRAGGFQNLGAKEGKDDVKANLAKNEFVMTADAVRGAGGGDIEVGAQRMYDTMKKLERKIA